MLKQKVEPMTASALKESINKIWDVPGYWKFLSLGKGYYNIYIVNHVERERLLARRIWNFQHGIVKLQRWFPEFNPYKVNSPIVNLWIRIYELPPEYFY